MKIVYLDVETTGIPCPQSGLVQLAGAIEIEGEVKQQFDFRIRPFPDDVISDEALAVNGLTRDELRTYEDPAKVFNQFEALLGAYVDRYDRTDKFHVVAYNANFDADHLRAWFEKNHSPYFGSWFWHPPLDVMAIAAMALMPERRRIENFRLATIAARLGIEVDPAKTHDALYDVHLARAVFGRLRERLIGHGCPGPGNVPSAQSQPLPKSS